MIESITINNVEKSPFFYIKDIFKDGDHFDFTPGINILVGSNGCGKTTLLKTIKHYMLCGSKNVTTARLGYEFTKFVQRFSEDEEFLDGISVKSDYSKIMFYYQPAADFTEDQSLESYDNFQLRYVHLNGSSGESCKASLTKFLENMFSTKNIEFPMEELKRQDHMVVTKILEYIERNKIEYPKAPVTVIMDEPDQRLDIYNLNEIYDIMSYKRNDLQLIATVHNPLLLYRLSKLDYVNIIEITPGYMEKLKQMVELYIK